MTKEEQIAYWINSADRDFNTMKHLYESKDYSWALFIGHLVIEKLIKGFYIKNTNQAPPLLHNLLLLCQKANIDTTEEQKDILQTITGFNIEARYDDIKENFYKKCTKEYTKLWIEKIEEIRKWIKNQFSQM